MSIKKRVSFVCLLSLSFVALWVAWRAHKLGFWVDDSSRVASGVSSYHLIGKMAGPEDIDLGSVDGQACAFVASCARNGEGVPLDSGHVYLLTRDAQKRSPQPTAKKPPFDIKRLNIRGGPGPIYPHGIDVYVDPVSGEQRVFMVNDRPEASSTVEVFLHEGNALRHEHTLQSDRLRSANDVLALDDDSCYVTSDSYWSAGWKRSLGIFFGLNRGRVFYMSPNETRLVADDLAFANGIAREERRLYVADTLGKVLKGYRIQADYELEPINPIRLPYGPDNLHYDEDAGRLLIALHPNMLQLSRHIDAPGSAKAVSSIWGVSFDDTNASPVNKEVLVTDAYSGASVAVPFMGGYLLGSVGANHLAYIKNRVR